MFRKLKIEIYTEKSKAKTSLIQQIYNRIDSQFSM